MFLLYVFCILFITLILDALDCLDWAQCVSLTRGNQLVVLNCTVRLCSDTTISFGINKILHYLNVNTLKICLSTQHEYISFITLCHCHLWVRHVKDMFLKHVSLEQIRLKCLFVCAIFIRLSHDMKSPGGGSTKSRHATQVTGISLTFRASCDVSTKKTEGQQSVSRLNLKTSDERQNRRRWCLLNTNHHSTVSILNP